VQSGRKTAGYIITITGVLVIIDSTLTLGVPSLWVLYWLLVTVLLQCTV